MFFDKSHIFCRRQSSQILHGTLCLDQNKKSLKTGKDLQSDYKHMTCKEKHANLNEFRFSHESRVFLGPPIFGQI